MNTIPKQAGRNRPLLLSDLAVSSVA